MIFEYRLYLHKRLLRIVQCSNILSLVMSFHMEFHHIDTRAILIGCRNQGIEYPYIVSDIHAAAVFCEDLKHNPYHMINVLQWMENEGR